MAIERGYEYYFWGHADVAVIGKDESASFADDVIACVESSLKSRPNWGIIYFHYDWFSAIRTDLVRQVTLCLVCLINTTTLNIYFGPHLPGWTLSNHSSESLQSLSRGGMDTSH